MKLGGRMTTSTPAQMRALRNKVRMTTGGKPPRKHKNLKKKFWVDYIRQHSMQNGIAQFEVKWVGFEETESTWEPFANLDGVTELRLYCDDNDLTCTATSIEEWVNEDISIVVQNS
jgi:hypothetical protein